MSKRKLNSSSSTKGSISRARSQGAGRNALRKFPARPSQNLIDRTAFLDYIIACISGFNNDEEAPQITFDQANGDDERIEQLQCLQGEEKSYKIDMKKSFERNYVVPRVDAMTSFKTEEIQTDDNLIIDSCFDDAICSKHKPTKDKQLSNSKVKQTIQSQEKYQTEILRLRQENDEWMQINGEQRQTIRNSCHKIQVQNELLSAAMAVIMREITSTENPLSTANLKQDFNVVECGRCVSASRIIFQSQLDKDQLEREKKQLMKMVSSYETEIEKLDRQLVESAQKEAQLSSKTEQLAKTINEVKLTLKNANQAFNQKLCENNAQAKSEHERLTKDVENLQSQETALENANQAILRKLKENIEKEAQLCFDNKRLSEQTSVLHKRVLILENKIQTLIQKWKINTENEAQFSLENKRLTMEVENLQNRDSALEMANQAIDRKLEKNIEKVAQLSLNNERLSKEANKLLYKMSVLKAPNQIYIRKFKLNISKGIELNARENEPFDKEAHDLQNEVSALGDEKQNNREQSNQSNEEINRSDIVADNSHRKSIESLTVELAQSDAEKQMEEPLQMKCYAELKSNESFTENGEMIEVCQKSDTNVNLHFPKTDLLLAEEAQATQSTTNLQEGRGISINMRATRKKILSENEDIKSKLALASVEHCTTGRKRNFASGPTKTIRNNADKRAVTKTAEPLLKKRIDNKKVKVEGDSEAQVVKTIGSMKPTKSRLVRVIEKSLANDNQNKQTNRTNTSLKKERTTSIASPNVGQITLSKKRIITESKSKAKALCQQETPRLTTSTIPIKDNKVCREPLNPRKSYGANATNQNTNINSNVKRGIMTTKSQNVGTTKLLKCRAIRKPKSVTLTKRKTQPSNRNSWQPQIIVRVSHQTVKIGTKRKAKVINARAPRITYLCQLIAEQNTINSLSADDLRFSEESLNGAELGKKVAAFATKNDLQVRLCQIDHLDTQVQPSAGSMVSCSIL